MLDGPVSMDGVITYYCDFIYFLKKPDYSLPTFVITLCANGSGCTQYVALSFVSLYGMPD